MKECPRCGAVVDAAASTCPNCGHAFHRTAILIGLSVALLFCLGSVALAGTCALNAVGVGGKPNELSGLVLASAACLGVPALVAGILVVRAMMRRR